MAFLPLLTATAVEKVSGLAVEYGVSAAKRQAEAREALPGDGSLHGN